MRMLGCNSNEKRRGGEENTSRGCKQPEMPMGWGQDAIWSEQHSIGANNTMLACSQAPHPCSTNFLALCDD